MRTNYFQRMEAIDYLIRSKSTGTPKQLARRLDISESLLYMTISFMKDMGAPIVYCRNRCSYYYERQGKFDFRFLMDCKDENE